MNIDEFQLIIRSVSQVYDRSHMGEFECFSEVGSFFLKMGLRYMVASTKGDKKKLNKMKKLITKQIPLDLDAHIKDYVDHFEIRKGEG